MKTYKLPISADPRTTLRNWAAELRKTPVVVESDFALREWEPKIRASGSMTIADVNIPIARYRVTPADDVEFFFRAIFTTGGVADTDVYFTLPIVAHLDSVVALMPLTAFMIDNATRYGVNAYIASETEGSISKYDSSNWSLGTTRQIFVTGWYRPF